MGRLTLEVDELGVMRTWHLKSLFANELKLPPPPSPIASIAIASIETPISSLFFLVLVWPDVRLDDTK